jgi:hypothetical protein
MRSLLCDYLATINLYLQEMNTRDNELIRKENQPSYSCKTFILQTRIFAALWQLEMAPMNAIVRI